MASVWYASNLYDGTFSYNTQCKRLSAKMSIRYRIQYTRVMIYKVSEDYPDVGESDMINVIEKHGEAEYDARDARLRPKGLRYRNC